MPMKHCLLILVAACLACAGCFDNHSRPADVLTVTSLDALAATNRAEVVSRTPILKDSPTRH